MPASSMPGGKLLIKNNPPPELGIHQTYYITHFMKVVTEAKDGSLPITKVYEYCRWQNIVDLEFFTSIMLSCYGIFYTELRKDAEKQAKSKSKG